MSTMLVFLLIFMLVFLVPAALLSICSVLLRESPSFQPKKLRLHKSQA
jgi:hypothetical protein